MASESIAEWEQVIPARMQTQSLSPVDTKDQLHAGERQ
jgi:hypothetical protein